MSVLTADPFESFFCYRGIFRFFSWTLFNISASVASQIPVCRKMPTYYRTVAILTLSVRRSNHSAKSHRIFSSPKWTTLTADTHIHHVHPKQFSQLLKFCSGLFSRLYSLSLIFRPCITTALFVFFHNL